MNVGICLSSRAASSQVLSAQVSLTAVFGMGTGVPSPPSTPTLSKTQRTSLQEFCHGNPQKILRMPLVLVTRTRFELVLPA